MKTWISFCSFLILSVIPPVLIAPEFGIDAVSITMAFFISVVGWFFFEAILLQHVIKERPPRGFFYICGVWFLTSFFMAVEVFSDLSILFSNSADLANIQVFTLAALIPSVLGYTFYISAYLERERLLKVLRSRRS